jgi:hypothetical protein
VRPGRDELRRDMIVLCSEQLLDGERVVRERTPEPGDAARNSSSDTSSSIDSGRPSLITSATKRSTTCLVSIAPGISDLLRQRVEGSSPSALATLPPRAELPSGSSGAIGRVRR